MTLSCEEKELLVVTEFSLGNPEKKNIIHAYISDHGMLSLTNHNQVTNNSLLNCDVCVRCLWSHWVTSESNQCRTSRTRWGPVQHFIEFIILIIRHYSHCTIVAHDLKTMQRFLSLALLRTFILKPVCVLVYLCVAEQKWISDVSLQYNYTFAVEEQAAKRIRPSVSWKLPSFLHISSDLCNHTVKLCFLLVLWSSLPRTTDSGCSPSLFLVWVCWTWRIFCMQTHYVDVFVYVTVSCVSAKH